MEVAGMEGVHQDVDDITVDFLKLIIEKDTGEEEIDVKDFHVERATEAGENFATIVYRIQASYICSCDGLRTNREAVYIGKFLPVQPKHRETLQQIHLFEREVVVYNDLIQTMINLQKEKLRREDILMPDVPRCIYANDESTPIAAVIMEDLCGKGFRLADKYQGLQPDEVRLLMKAYGQFHALGVLVDRHTEFSSRPIFCENALEKLPEFGDMLRNGLEIVWKVLENISGQEENARRVTNYIKRVDGGRDRFFQLIGAKGRLQTFIHGDCWCNNMMFRYDPDTRAPVGIRILDLQDVAYGNPCRDLLEFLYCSTSKETRKETPAFFKLYYDTLVATAQSLGITLEYSYQDFQKDVEEREEFGFLMAMLGIPRSNLFSEL
ncbi:unnamed protein product [Darwinula stevensoni]|uniref:CHK kinase-like domain-containing protein n=1 Tax=Darwinula stevensoni TaxID=69355 RepID=A0A7R9FRR4_9CRUS|nr:unnamed protein product [Darwinula stevensoni]CAG0902233.1 unnamed protein product [Darwinula stevensoni]